MHPNLPELEPPEQTRCLKNPSMIGPIVAASSAAVLVVIVDYFVRSGFFWPT